MISSDGGLQGLEVLSRLPASPALAHPERLLEERIPGVESYVSFPMTKVSAPMSPASCRAARMLLRLSQAEVAKLAGISVSTLRRFESGNGELSAYAARQLRDAFDREGILFVLSCQKPALK